MKQVVPAVSMIFIIVIIFIPTQTCAESIVTVTNASDRLDGDIASIAALINDPGSDGSISFREALYACNNSIGPKRIQFDLGLAGSTILLDPDHDGLLYLSSSELTIDGDVNDDEIPDICIDGSLGQSGTPSGVGLVVVSNQNAILHLELKEFASSAVIMACPGPDCGPKEFSDIIIQGNILSSQRATGPHIFIGVSGLALPELFTQMSMVTWRDIVVSGNSFSSGSQDAAGAIALIPGAAGASDNIIENVLIDRNRIEGGIVAVQVAAMDCSSDYFNVPGPTVYSDRNIVRNLRIEQNIIEDNIEAIGLSAANDGGRANQIFDVEIIENQISAASTGITVFVAGWGDNQRSTANNQISNVEIRLNQVSQVANGIQVQVGHDPEDGSGIGCNANELNHMQIAGNAISNYSGTGIQICGGFSADYGASNNVLDGLNITENLLSTNQSSAVGLKIIGGLSMNGITEGNLIQGITMSHNLLGGNSIGIWLIGGQGRQSRNNQVSISSMGENTLYDNIVDKRQADNDEGASGNVLSFEPLDSDENEPGGGGCYINRIQPK